MLKKYIIFTGLFLAFSFLFTFPALAADKYWTGNAATSTADGGKDFWNIANWDTAVPVSGDNIWLFATSTSPSTASSTIVISTPVSLGAGSIFVGYNPKGNTLANSSAPVNVLIKEGASLTNTGTFEVGTSSTFFINSGSLSVGTTTIDQAASTTINAVTTGGATSTVTIAGNFSLRSAALYTSPSNSTTTINLPSGTSGTTVFSAGTSSPTFGYLVFGGTGTTNLQNNVTIANRLNIAAGRTLTAGGGTITLSGSNSNSSDFPLEVTGTFTAATSTVTYSGTSATTVASTTYATVNFNGATTYTLGGNTTATATSTIASGATLAISTFTFTATGATWTNSGTVTEGVGGKILNAATTVQFTNSSGTAISSVSADGNGSIYLTVTDPDENLNASAIETLAASITAKSAFPTTQTVTLTETTVSSGIFRGGLTFTLGGSNVGGALAYNGSGSLNYTWTDAQDSADTSSCTSCATFTGSATGGGGGGSGGAVAVVVPATTAPMPATTTATPAPILAPTPTPAPTPAPVAPITPAVPTPQVVALGFNFVRTLTFGSRNRNNDVSNLQTALKTDPSIYPEGLVTGYFGPATRRAVRRFQEKYSIAQKGDLGYGRVGPKTRAQLNALYGGH